MSKVFNYSWLVNFLVWWLCCDNYQWFQYGVSFMTISQNQQINKYGIEGLKFTFKRYQHCLAKFDWLVFMQLLLTLIISVASSCKILSSNRLHLSLLTLEFESQSMEILSQLLVFGVKNAMEYRQIEMLLIVFCLYTQCCSY